MSSYHSLLSLGREVTYFPVPQQTDTRDHGEQFSVCVVTGASMEQEQFGYKVSQPALVCDSCASVDHVCKILVMGGCLTHSECGPCVSV